MWWKNNIEFTGFLLFLILGVAPLILGIGYALLYSFGLIGILSEGATLHHWISVFSGFEVPASFMYSFYIAFTSIGISVSLALILTVMFRNYSANSAFSYLLYLPLAIPAMVAAFFVYQMFGKAGLISGTAFHLNLISNIQAFPDLVNDRWGIGIITAHTMLAAPFFTILFLNIYKNERIDELNQLAVTLGSSKRNQFFDVTAPVVLTKGFPTILLYFIFVMGSYEIPLLLGQQSPEMVSVLAIRKLRRFNLMDIPEAYIIAVLYVLIVIALVVFLFKRKRFSNEF